MVEPDEVANFMHRDIHQVNLTPIGTDGKGEVPSVVDDISVKNRAIVDVRIQSGHGNDASAGGGLQRLSGLVEDDNVSPVASIGGGPCIDTLIDKLQSRRLNRGPRIKGMADRAEGDLRGHVC